MNSNYTEFKFPQIKAHPWTKVRKNRYVGMMVCYYKTGLVVMRGKCVGIAPE